MTVHAPGYESATVTTPDVEDAVTCIPHDHGQRIT